MNPGHTYCRIASHLTFVLGLHLLLGGGDDDDCICNDCIERMCKFVLACIRNAKLSRDFLLTEHAFEATFFHTVCVTLIDIIRSDFTSQSG
jgi:hypothetical protein